MKLRIHDNSVRIRLTQGEVATLAAGGRVCQTTRFSIGSALTASVEPSEYVATPGVTFDRGCIAVFLPLAKVLRWANSQQVGIEGSQEIERGEWLKILIEKDFKCLHVRVGEDADAFPHPAS